MATPLCIGISQNCTEIFSTLTFLQSVVVLDQAKLDRISVSHKVLSFGVEIGRAHV